MPIAQITYTTKYRKETRKFSIAYTKSEPKKQKSSPKVVPGGKGFPSLNVMDMTQTLQSSTASQKQSFMNQGSLNYVKQKETSR